jgi:hypothetical protein
MRLSLLSWALAERALSFADGGLVPSCPLELMTTVFTGPEIDLPLTPARKAAVCFPLVPIRILPASPATPALAMRMD